MKNTLFVLVCATSCVFGQEGNGPFPAVMEQDPSITTLSIKVRKNSLRGSRSRRSNLSR